MKIIHLITDLDTGRAATVATTEKLFQKAMSKVQENSEKAVLRVSLLPECCRLESVVDQLKKWLN
jgi:hypothetical protein